MTKIIYCRKQAQAALEWVNANNPNLTIPLDFKTICEQVKKAFLDESERYYNGVIYTFFRIQDTKATYTCIIGVLPNYTLDPSSYSIEVKEGELYEAMCRRNQTKIPEVIAEVANILHKSTQLPDSNGVK